MYIDTDLNLIYIDTDLDLFDTFWTRLSCYYYNYLLNSF